MVAPVTRLDNDDHYKHTIYLAHYQNHYEPLVPKPGFDWSFERTNLLPVINKFEEQTSFGITLGQKSTTWVEKLSVNRNLANDFNILQETVLKDDQGFIKVVSSKRKKKNNLNSAQNSANCPGLEYKPDQPTHCNPATERNRKVNCKASKPSLTWPIKQVGKSSKPDQVSKPSLPWPIK